jgi:primary-amine oxidase
MTRRRFALAGLATLVLGGAFVAAGPARRSEAAATPANCSAPFTIDVSLNIGTRWRMCFETRNAEGIVLRDVGVTVPGQPARIVLGQMNLAQLHVPYDDNGARYHDLSDYGLGGGNLQNLTAAECPGGTLRQDGAGKNVLCVTTKPTGYAYKSYGTQRQGQSVTAFYVSAIGAYNYIVGWNFLDSGAIEPFVGATGQLQRYTSNSAYGWNVRSGNTTYGVAHAHNYYWRFDFDVNGTPNDDVVEELQTTPNGTREAWTTTRTAFTSETSRQVAPESMRSWRVRDAAVNADGHALSYQIVPDSSQVFRGPSYEPWTASELYVTRNKTCEVYASHNPTANGCANNVAAFVNGESLGGQDLVVWYGHTFYHLPSDEDESLMHAHWSSLTLQPRDMTAVNPTTGNAPSTTTSTTSTTSTTTTRPPGTTTTSTTSTTSTTTTRPPGTTTTTTPGGPRTTTYTNAAAMTIRPFGAASAYPSTLDVAGSTGTIQKVVVRLRGLSHAYPADMDIALVGPGGQRVMLMSDVAEGNAANGVTLTFDAAAAASLGLGPLVTGSYKPTDREPGDVLPAPAPTGTYGTSLGVFNGTSANGRWSLYVTDDSNYDGGSLANGWELTITTA